MITRKTPAQIAFMRQAGRVVAEMHEKCTEAARPGATTLDIDKVARDVLDRRGARSNFLGYHGFPAVICTSPNDVIVHGIPGDYRLEEGDILSIDAGAITPADVSPSGPTTGPARTLRPSQICIPLCSGPQTSRYFRRSILSVRCRFGVFE